MQLYFKLGDGSFIGSGSHYTINISAECRWEESERHAAIVKIIEHANKILEDAKVNHISQLVNIPVEVEINKNSFKDFSILTEVLYDMIRLINEEIIQNIKDCGQALIDNAEKITCGYTYLQDITITCYVTE